MRSWWMAFRSVFVLVIVASLSPAGYAGRIIYVDDDAPGVNDGTNWKDAYWCLQDALAAAQSGDEIYVAQGIYRPDRHGIYHERLGPQLQASGDRTAAFQLINGVALRGGYAGFGSPDPNARDVEAYETILSGDLAGDDAELETPLDMLLEATRAENSCHVVVSIETFASATLDGFVVTGGAAGNKESDGGGMRNIDGSPTIANCTFTWNSAFQSGGGLGNGNQGHPTLTECTFACNLSVGHGGGMHSKGVGSVTLADCTFIGNWSYAAGGGIYGESASITLTDCSFTENRAEEGGGGIYNKRGSDATFVNCRFTRNVAKEQGGALRIRPASGDYAVAVTNCSFIENSAGNGGGVQIEGDSNTTVLRDCTFVRNSASGGAGGFGGGAGIQLTRCSFLENSAEEGGGAAVGNSSFISTLLYGRAKLVDCTFTSNSASREGGGLTADNCNLVNCTFEGNAAEENGGGVFAPGDTSPEWTNCTFRHNSAGRNGGGVCHGSQSGLMLTDCTFTANEAGEQGGGAWVDQGNPTYARCRFVGNSAGWGGGIALEGGSLMATSCSFVGNTAFEEGGGLRSYWDDATPTLVNCVFAGNNAKIGGAVSSEKQGVLTNCTVTGNVAEEDGGGLMARWESVVLSNCILWGNRIGAGDPNLAMQVVGENVTLSHCCVQGGPDAGGNIGADPLFVRVPDDGGDGWGDDPATPDADEGANDDFGQLWLRAESPCVDAGDSSALAQDTADLDEDGDTAEPMPFDLDGAKRVVGAAVDIGAYEYHGVAVVHVDADAPGANNGSNWFNAFTNLRDALAYAQSAVKPVEIRVAQGLYRPDQGANQTPGNREAMFQLINWVTIKGGYAGQGTPDPDKRDLDAYETVLSGDLNGDDVLVNDPCALFVERTRTENCYHVVTGSAVDDTAVLDGVVIAGGNANGADWHRMGGGLYAAGGDPTLTRCVLRSNVAYVGAGLFSENGNPSLAQCTLSANCAHEQGGALALGSSDLKATDCTFAGNVAGHDGGAAFCGGSAPTFKQCKFLDNWAADRGGAAHSTESSPEFIGCIFRANVAESGGGLFMHKSEPVFANCVLRQGRAREGAGVFSQRLSVVSMTNCMFGQNRAAERGGGFYCQASDVRLSNCTLTHNTAGWQGGGLYGSNSDVTLANSILWANVAQKDPEIASYENTVDLEITHCNVRGGLKVSAFVDSDTAGNLDVDPNLTPDGHLTAFSPCIDAGDSNSLPQDSLDLDNDAIHRETVPFDIDAGPRQSDGEDMLDIGSGEQPRVDIGADEFMDSDGDRLPDGWEERYFATPTGANPGDDADGDTLTNLQEYELFSSDPTVAPLVDGSTAPDEPADGTQQHPFLTIQQGLDAAHNGDTVLVAPGTYSGGDNTDLDFRGKSVVLCTIEGAETTVIDCAGAGRAFDFHSGETAGSAIVGYTIRNGYADEGGAIRCAYSSPQIRECVIEGGDHPAHGTGGVYGYLSFPTFADCVFRDNGACGIQLEYGGARMEGVVELSASQWTARDTMYTGPGAILMQADAFLRLNDVRIRCSVRGPGAIEVPLTSELIIEGAANVDLAGDNGNGSIRCDGLLRVRDGAQVHNAHILVTRASFEGDVIISNSVIDAEAGSPYGQFFIEDTVTVTGNDIHADGDRYMDLDPTVFRGIVANNRIYITITEGQGDTRGGLLELRGKDLHSSACELDEFLCPIDQVPAFSTATWTIERLELLSGAKINLTNRFDFGNGDQLEVMYVKDLVLGPDSILNAGFHRLYYETMDAAETATSKNVPVLGFSLNIIAFDDADEFTGRIVDNNFEHPRNSDYDRIHVQRVAGLDPDPDGMMRMCNLRDTDPASPTHADLFHARAKGLFGKANEGRILVLFEYLFESADPGTELIIYLSDAPELLDHADPRRSEHYLEVARLAAPPLGRPGSVGSGRFGIFHTYVRREHLNFIRGTRIELELVGPDGSCVLINNWDPQVHCDGICMDLNWSDTADEEDFMIVLGECGTSAELSGDAMEDRSCLDGLFSNDGYVDAYDVHSWDWALHADARLNLCPGLPLVALSDDAFFSSAAFSPSPGPAGLTTASAGLSDLLILGKRSTSLDPLAWKLKDRLYSFDGEGTYVESSTPDSDRCNVRLVRGGGEELYAVSSETGVTRLLIEGLDEAVVSPGQVDCAAEPRYGRPAQVYIGIQGEGTNGFGRPLLDAAFAGDDVCVVPVVVGPEDEESYVAAARLRPLVGAEGAYELVTLYDDSPPPGDNQHRNHLREIEVDEAGNVYVLNVHSLNESDVLTKHTAGGAVLRRYLGTPAADVYLPDPIALHVSNSAGLLYLASAQVDSENPGSTVVYGLSLADLSLQRRVVVEGLQHITGITEKPGTGRLYAVGFAMIEPVPDYPSALAAPFYYPCLAEIPPDADTVEAVALIGSGDHDLALPTSIIWTGHE